MQGRGGAGRGGAGDRVEVRAGGLRGGGKGGAALQLADGWG